MSFKIIFFYLLSFIGFYVGFILLASLAENYDISYLYVVNVKEGGVDVFPTINPFIIMFLYVLGSHTLISRMKKKA
ncbi:hypothetical protein [Rossellomorea vietnamensis]|uniref:hypothetical protein n=1 Tax=Rossellomorea vietnamensis TaxID=218284 RepID=UPI000BF84AD7|nr:hypothetical protein ATG71_2158 [Bacillus sp. es.034]